MSDESDDDDFRADPVMEALANEQIENMPAFQKKQTTIGRNCAVNSKGVCMVVIGKTGTGKSTLANALLLGENLEEEEMFNTSASINACTYLTSSAEGTLLKNGVNPLKVVDTPGLSESMSKDAEHVINMIKFLKKEVRFVKLFCFTVNGQETRFDQATRLLLKTFEASLGPEFWDHCAVVYTRWGSAPLDVKRRKKSKLTEEGRREEVLEMLNQECPASKGKNI